MNTNLLADTILEYLTSKHNRSYRNKAPKNPNFPYVIFRIDSGIDTYPSEDLYLNIDIYEKTDNSVRDIEDIADNIDTGLNHITFNTEEFNMQFEREQRQYVPPEELVSSHLVNLRYVVRVYSK
jgi:hypothetical protein